MRIEAFPMKMRSEHGFMRFGLQMNLLKRRLSVGAIILVRTGESNRT
jgi:hypothetical protein